MKRPLLLLVLLLMAACGSGGPTPTTPDTPPTTPPDTPPPGSASALPVAEEVNDTIDLVDQVHTYTFEASTGDSISIYQTNVSMSGSTALYLEGPDGAEVAREENCCDVQLTPTLNADGVYTLYVDPVADATGQYSLLYVNPRITAVGALPVAEEVNDTIDLVGQVHTYTFEASTGDSISIYQTNVSMSGSTALYLEGPDGAEVAREENCCDVQLTPTLNADGVYTLYVDPVADATGQYSLLVEDLP